MLETSWPLFFGDNLDVPRETIPDGCVDLIYFDPLSDGTSVEAQIAAFEDTWSWDQAVAEAFAELEEKGSQTSPIKSGIAGW